MQPLPRDVIAVARVRQGLLTRDDLAAVSRRQRAAMIESGQLLIVHRDVYRLASHPETFEQRCVAACLTRDDAVLSGPTAARLYGLRKVATDAIYVVARRLITLDGVVGRRSNFLLASHVRRRGDLRMLTPARLVCDLGAHLDDDDLESVVEQMLVRGLVTLPAVRNMARQFSKPGRNGALRVARVLDSRPTWRRPVDSDIELQLLRALERRRLDVVTQLPVTLDSGRIVHLDLALPDLRLGIEVDHVTWHGGRLDVQRDKARDRELLRVGWTVTRATDEDVTLRLDATADDIAAIAARLLADRSRPQAG